MFYTNKKYSFTLCAMILLLVLCSLSHGKRQSDIRRTATRVIRNVEEINSSSTDENETDEDMEITTMSPDPDFEELEVALTPSRVHTKPTITVTATRIGISRHFSTMSASPVDDSYVEETLTAPTEPPVLTSTLEISPEKELEADIENLMPIETENTTIVTPAVVTEVLEHPLIMQKTNSSEERTEDKEATGEDNNQWDIFDSVADIDNNQVVEKLPDPIPLVSPTQSPNPSDQIDEEEFAEVFNAKRRLPRRRLRNNNVPFRRMRKVRVQKNETSHFPFDDFYPGIPKPVIPNSFNQGELKPSAPSRRGNPRMTRRFRSTTTTTTTNPNKILEAPAPTVVTAFPITEESSSSSASGGPKKQRITPILLSSPSISNFKSDKTGERYENEEHQVEAPTANAFSDKNGEYFDEHISPSHEKGEGKIHLDEPVSPRVNVHHNDTGEWLDSEHSKHVDIPVTGGQYDEREDWEKNYMKLQQNSFYSPSEEDHEEETPIITIDDIRKHTANATSSSRQGLINNSELEPHDAAVIIEHHHHDTPDSTAGFYSDKPSKAIAEVDAPGPSKYSSEAPSIFEAERTQYSAPSPQQVSDGSEYFPEQPNSGIPYPPDVPASSSQSFNPYLSSADAPTVTNFVANKKGSHFDRTKHHLIAHPSTSDLGLFDKPIFMDSQDSISKVKGVSESTNNYDYPRPYPPIQGYAKTTYHPPKAINYFPPEPPHYSGEIGNELVRPGIGYGSPADQHKEGSRKAPLDDHFKSMRNSIIFKPPPQSNFPTFESSMPSFSHMPGGPEKHQHPAYSPIHAAAEKYPGFSPMPGANPHPSYSPILSPVLEGSDKYNPYAPIPERAEKYNPSYSPIPGGGEKYPSPGFQDQDNGVLEIHHHHFPDGTENTIYPGQTSTESSKYPPTDSNRFPLDATQGKKTAESTWPEQAALTGLPSQAGPAISFQSGPPKSPLGPLPPPNTLPNYRSRSPGRQVQYKNPIKSGDFSGSHAAISGYHGSEYPPSPPLTLPMPGLVSIPTPPSESYAMNEVTPNQHYPPHTHSMASYSDYEPANPPLPSGHALAQHFDHFVQNAGEFPSTGHSSELDKHTGEKESFRPNPPTRSRRPNHNGKHHFKARRPTYGGSSGGGQPEGATFHHSEPSPVDGGGYYGNLKDNDIQGNGDVRDQNNLDLGPSLYDYQPQPQPHQGFEQEKDRPYDFYRPSPENDDPYKAQYEEENKHQTNNNGYKYNKPEGDKKPAYNELLENFKDFAENQENQKGKEQNENSNNNNAATAEDAVNPYSETPYIIMFPNMYPHKGAAPPPRPHLEAQVIQKSPETSATSTEPYTGNPEKLLGPGVKVVPVHPRHQIMKALATKQYLQKLESLQAKEKRPPNTIFTPYGVLVPMGISSPASIASQTAAPPKLTTLLTAHSHIFSGKTSAREEGKQKNLPTDEKALLSVLLGASKTEQSGRNAKFPTVASKPNANSDTMAAMDSALDLLAEKLAAKLSPLEDVLSPPPVKSYHHQSYNYHGSYSELQPVKTSLGGRGGKAGLANVTIKSSNNKGKLLFPSSIAAKKGTSEKSHADFVTKDSYKVSPPPSSGQTSSKYLKSLLKDRLVEMLEETYQEVGNSDTATIPGKGYASNLKEQAMKRKENSVRNIEQEAGASVSPMTSNLQAPFTLVSTNGGNMAKANRQQATMQQQQNPRPQFPHPGGILNAIRRLFSFGGRNKQENGKIMGKHSNGTVIMKSRGDFAPRKSIKHSQLPHQAKHSMHDGKQGRRKEKPIFPSMYGFKSAAEMEKALKMFLKSKASANEDDTGRSLGKENNPSNSKAGFHKQQQPGRGFMKAASMDETKWSPHQSFVLEGLSTSASNPMAIKVIPGPQLGTSKFQPVMTGAQATRRQGSFRSSPTAFSSNLLPASNTWKPMPDSLSFINSLVPQESTTSAAPYLANLYAAVNPASNKISILNKSSTGHRIQPRSI